jgi:hypothetical protein
MLAPAAEACVTATGSGDDARAAAVGVGLAMGPAPARVDEAGRGVGRRRARDGVRRRRQALGRTLIAQKERGRGEEGKEDCAAMTPRAWLPQGCATPAFAAREEDRSAFGPLLRPDMSPPGIVSVQATVLHQISTIFSLNSIA